MNSDLPGPIPSRARPEWMLPATRHPRATYRNVIEAVDRVLAAEAIHFAPSIRRYLYAPPPQNPDARVLDVGCGVGQGCAVLHRFGWRRIVGIDVSPTMDLSVRRLGIKFQRCAAERYGPSAPFDMITCCDALEHMASAATVLGRMRTWLTPTGILYLTLPIEGEISRNPFHLNAWSKARAHLLLAKQWRLVRDGMHGINEYWAWLAPKGHLTWWETVKAIGQKENA